MATTPDTRSAATSYDVARMFLVELGAPVTDSMTRAVAIWLRFESGGTIRGNNPWNLHSGEKCPKDTGYCAGQGSLPGQIGNRYAGSGDQNVAVFATLQDGVRASAKNLTKRPTGDWTGYDKIVTAARSGSAVGFLTAVQNSRWSAGHYSYSKLVSAFASSLAYNTTIKFVNYTGDAINTTVAKSVTKDVLLEALAALNIPTDDGWGTSHVLTTDEAKRLYDYLTKNGYGVDPAIQTAEKLNVGVMLQSLGQPNSFFPAFTESANEAIDTATGFIGGVASFIFDVQNWMYLLSLVGGSILLAYGTSRIIASTGSAEPRTKTIRTDVRKLTDTPGRVVTEQKVTT